jgi:glutathione S-transferase
MIKVHDLVHSRSSRIVWLLEELELPYEQIVYQREPSMMAPPAMKEIHPLGKAPIIQDGDVTLAESGAIVEYILERHGKGRLRPAAMAPNYPQYLQWVHYAEGSLMPPMVFDLLIRATGTQAELLSQVVKGFAQQHLQHLNDVLADRPYLAGKEFTAADIMMEFSIDAASGVLLPGMERESWLTGFSNLQQYLDRVHARPAYQRTLKKINKL